MECRICLSEGFLTSENPLLTPCKCDGSMKYVHKNCLQIWRQYPERHRVCTTCQAEYTVRPSHLLAYEIVPDIDRYILGGDWMVYMIFVFVGMNAIIDDSKILKWQPYLMSVHLVYAGYLSCQYVDLLRDIQNGWMYLKMTRKYILLPVAHALTLIVAYNNSVICCLPLLIIYQTYFINHIDILKEINYQVAKHNLGI